MRTELALTYITHKPVLVRDRHTGIDLCFWNGVSMTRNYGRTIAAEVWCNLFQSEHIKTKLLNEHRRAIHAGAFQTDKWDNLVLKQNPDSMLSLLKQYLSVNHSNKNHNKGYDKNRDFLQLLKKQYTAQEALSWFEKNHIVYET